MLEPDVSQRATIFDLHYDVWIQQAVSIDQYKFYDIFVKDSGFFAGFCLI